MEMIRFEHVNKNFGVEKVLVDFSLHIDRDRSFRMWKDNHASHDQRTSDTGFRKDPGGGKQCGRGRLDRSAEKNRVCDPE